MKETMTSQTTKTTVLHKNPWWKFWAPKIEEQIEEIDIGVKEGKTEMQPLNDFIGEFADGAYKTGEKNGYNNPTTKSLTKNIDSKIKNFNSILDGRLVSLLNSVTTLKSKLESFEPGIPQYVAWEILVKQREEEILRLQSDVERKKWSNNVTSSLKEGFADGAEKYSDEDAGWL